MGTTQNKSQINKTLATIIKNTYGKPELKNEYNLACEEFLKINNPLILEFIFKYATNNKKLIYHDLIVNFQQAAIDACLSYDETKGASITTYLYNTLEFARLQFRREDVNIKLNLNSTTYSKLHQAYLKIKETGLPLTAKTLEEYANCTSASAHGFLLLNNIKALSDQVNVFSKRTKLSVIQDGNTLSHGNIVAFNTPTNLYEEYENLLDNDFTIEDLLVSAETPENIVSNADKLEELKLIVSFLPETKAKIISLIYFNNLPAIEVSKNLQVSPQWIRFVQSSALENLRILYQDENIKTMKLITKLKEKNKKLQIHNKHVSLEQLIEGENISNKTLYRAYRIKKFKFFKKLDLNKLENENFNLLNLSELEKRMVKDVILSNTKQELTNIHGENIISSLYKLEHKPNKNENSKKRKRI